MGFVVAGFCSFDDAVNSLVDVVNGPLIFIDDEDDSVLDVDVVGRVILVVVDSSFRAVVIERFSFDFVVDPSVGVVDVCFI